MNITRRNALKQCLVITVGAAIIPSCMQETRRPVFVLNSLRLNAGDETLVMEICETIIPATDTPGARDTGAHEFVLRMVDDMYTSEEQQQFVRGLNAFDKLAKEKLDMSFVRAAAPRRQKLLTDLLDPKSKKASPDVTAFLKTMKKLTVQGFMTSKHYLTKVRVYELVPGRFHGCSPVSASNQKEIQNNRKQGQI